MSKKRIIIILSILVIVVAIISLYGTFATNTTVNTSDSQTYNVTLTNSTSEVTMPASSSKTIYYKLSNTNKGTVKYGVAYSGTNITVKIYSDSKDPETGLINYGENKFIKLYITNTSTTDSTATITTVLGYENGGDLIVPTGKTLVTEVYIKSQALATLTNLGLSVDTTHTPDFTTVSGNSGVKYNSDDTTTSNQGDSTNGIYEAEDDLGTSYYFRGAVENNYVYFAGYYWRIVRINGDGTVRMILSSNFEDAGPISNNVGNTVAIPLVQSLGSSNYIERSAYNENYSDNAYVGYMYGTAGSSTYEATHSNTNNSTIKTVIDNWYQNNLSSYSSYIADAIYCNDRSVTPVDSFAGMSLTGTGIGTEVTAYSGLTRNWINHTPSLNCTNNNDKFTTSSTLGNGKLTYPVGLITTDEVAMAGGVTYDVVNNSYITNTDYYLYTGSYYWTMTPDAFAGGYAYVGNVNDDGRLSHGNVEYSYRAVRPVVSLKSDAITGGSGTQENPFYVDEVPGSSDVS
ncbi:MAG: hypothetical protein ACI4VL_02560 [Bacilli bacterium]